MLFRAKATALVLCGMLVALVCAQVAPLNVANADTQSCTSEMGGVEIDGNLVADAPGKYDWFGPLGQGFLQTGGSCGQPNPFGSFPLLNINSISPMVRDDCNAGGSKDASVFGSTSDKNNSCIVTGLEPWQCKTGDVPQKNDLTEAYATVFQDLEPTSPTFGDYLLFVAVGHRSTDGDNHLDFEFNQAGVTSCINGVIVGGPGTELTGGRTLGDFIVSVDFSGGGNNGQVTLRTWEANAAATCGYQYSNPIPDQLGPLGFACTNSNPLDDRADVIVTAPCQAWQPSPQCQLGANYQTRQFIEAIVNLSDAGVFDNLVCGGNSTLMYKSRSSTSFTSELKDFIRTEFQILPPPPCAIEGPDSVCPGATAQFCGPAGFIYSWTATGATIIGDPTAQCVTVQAGSTCGSYTVELMVTDATNCSNTCEKTVNVVDTTNPVLVGVPTGGDLGCNPPPPSCATVTATDDCDTDVPVTCTPGTITGTCNKSQTFTYTATDACGNSAVGTATYTWKDDTTIPVLVGVPPGGDLGCNPTPPSCAAVTATDNCDGNLGPANCVPGTITGDCIKSQTFTYSATDACGNTASQTATYTWTDDTTPPVLVGVPPGGPLGCNPVLPICDLTVTATDNCDTDVPVTCVPGEITGECFKSQIFTYSVTDECGNTASQTATYTWTDDTTPPVLVGVPTGGPLGCNPTAPSCGNVTATDNCDTDVPVTCVPGEVTGECFKSGTITYSVTDECGNTASQTATYTWTDDTTPPVLVGVPPGGPLGCNPVLPICDLTVTATDNCDTDVPVTCVPGEITGECFKSQIFTYSVTDECGNTASQTATYTWTDDTTPPVLVGVPPGGPLGCNPVLPICDLTVTATDNCDTDVPVTCVPGEITGECFKSQIFTYSVTDECGNTASQTATYTWTDDTTPPVLVGVPPGGPLGCNPVLPICDLTVTATDNCDTDVPVTCVPGEITGECFKSQIFTYSVTDECGNTASQTATYTWTDDTTPPVLVGVPPGGPLGCNPVLPICDLTVTATDNCDTDVPVTCVPGEITGECFKSQIFTYSVTDECGNTASQTATYTWTDDTTPPVLVGVPPGGPLGCNPVLPICDLTVTATDNCDTDVPVTCVPGEITGECFKSQIFTYSVTDECGNTASQTATYTWTDDTTPPVLVGVPPGGPLGCNPVLPICDLTVTATDNCDTDVPVTCVPGEITGECFKSQIFTYSVTDECGNTASQTATYTWTDDTTPPVLVGVPTGGPLGCNPTAPSCGNVTATDNCDTDVPVTCVPGEVTGECFKSGTITYSVTDECGNTASQTATYTWTDDTTPPVLVGVPPGGPLGCNPVLPICDLTVTATDNCDTDVPVTCVPGEITGECFKSQIFTYSVTDECGNTASQTATYTWTDDTTPPVLVGVPPGGPLGCNPVLPICDLTVTATDNCDTDVPVTCVPGEITGECFKSQIFTYSVTDECGNTASQTATYTWTDDTTPPVLVGVPPGGPLGCNPVLPICDLTVTATDNCDTDVPVTCVPGEITGECFKSQIFTYSVTDECGNTASQTATYTWTDDTTPPVLVGVPPGGPLGCNPVLPICDLTVTATDNCDTDVPVTCVPGEITGECFKSQIFTYSVTDECGNTASQTATYTWTDDTTPPVLVGVPPGGPLGCNPVLPICDLTVTATDNCDTDVPVTCVPGEITGECFKSQIFTYSVTDECGNTASQTATYTWTDDTTPPVLVGVPPGGPLGCNPVLPICDLTVTATDNCDTDVPVTCVPGEITGECFKSQIFTYSVTDECGNTASQTATYTWTDDTTPPVLVGVPPGGPLGCNPVLPICDLTVTATDNCDTDVPVTCVPGEITGECFKSQIFTYSVTDECGNTASQTATYTWTDDTTPPVLVGVPTGGPLGCNPVLPICDLTVTATDNCDTDVPVTCVPGEITGECFKSQIFTYSVTDECGNTASQTATYTWTDDTTPPVLVGVPTGGPLGCNPVLPICDLTVTATDNCDTDVPVTCVPGEITGECFKSQIFTYSVTDECGNTASQTATYTWTDDTTPPVLVGVPPGGPLGCNPVLPICDLTVTATDNCDTDVPVTCSPGAITGECFKSQTFTYSVVDECGNSASETATYTWTDDTIPPSITCPGGLTGTCGQPVSYDPPGTDNCDGSVPVTCNPPSGSVFPVGATTVTCTALDDCGNTGSCSFSITVPNCGEGCTPGFWGGGLGATLWNTVNDPQWSGDGTNPFIHTTLFNSFFTAHPTLVGLTMFQLVNNGGGPIPARKTARMLVAAYLNASYGLTFPYTTGELSTMWTTAVANGNPGLIALFNLLTPANEAGCPIGRHTAASMISEDATEFSQTPGVESESVGNEIQLYKPAPNPFTTSTRFAFAIPSGNEMPVDVAVFDLSGRRLRTLASGVRGAGRHEASWDGRDESGARVNKGIYYIRAVIGTERRTVSVVYLK